MEVYEWDTSNWTSATLENCRAMLRSQITDFERIYVVIDAIDECEARTRLDLFDTLLRLREERPQVHFLISSTNTDFKFLELWNPVHFVLKANVEGLAKFIQKQMKYKARLQRFFNSHTDLIEVTETILIERAGGRYRASVVEHPTSFADGP